LKIIYQFFVLDIIPLGWCYTWLPKPKPIKLKTFPFFEVKGNIEEERKRYYSEIV
jgi:hypothetical protein